METLQTDEALQTESPVNLATLAKCAHRGCTCTVTTGETYCSDYCLEHSRVEAAADDDGCNCGHPECAPAAVMGGAPVGTIVS